MKNQILIYGAIAVVIIGIVAILSKKIFKRSPEKLELIKHRKQERLNKRVAQSQTLSAEYSNPTLFLKGKSYSKNDEIQAQKFATEFKKAFVPRTITNPLGIGTDESKVFSLASSMGTKTMYSLTIKKFNEMFKKSLPSELISELSKTDLSRFNGIIKSLPIS